MNSGVCTMATEKETNVEREPFKLCFSKDRVQGRSDMRMSEVQDEMTPPKSNDKNDEENAYAVADKVDTSKEHTEQEMKDERFKKDQASLSSHEIGWWYEEDKPTKDSSIDSHKKSTEFPNLN
ncbi:uncharacterized protein LOC113464805 [Ceratina calcarata]|uniref:Uncharacterized protein LOC113464805 n=1 Tax=Ceratina calcarata TaxID=156304 RepID=A0AAJ7S7A7_9HYME|nr:uncharacterized protein LOC113464805 [Ceratina calcarata]